MTTVQHRPEGETRAGPPAPAWRSRPPTATVPSTDGAALRWASACMPILGLLKVAFRWIPGVIRDPRKRNSTYWGPIVLALSLHLILWMLIPSTGNQPTPHTGGSGGSGGQVQAPAKPGQVVQPGIDHNTPLEARLTYADSLGDQQYASVAVDWSNSALVNFTNYWIEVRVAGTGDLTSAYNVLENSALPLLYPRSSAVGGQAHIRTSGTWDTQSGPSRLCQCVVDGPTGMGQKVTLQFTYRAREGKPAHWTVAVLATAP